MRVLISSPSNEWVHTPGNTPSCHGNIHVFHCAHCRTCVCGDAELKGKAPDIVDIVPVGHGKEGAWDFGDS